MTLAAIDAAAGRDGLEVLGAFHPGEADATPPGCGTLVLLGPAGPDFWQVFRASAEFADGARDPLDRWSRRVVGALAAGLRAEALYPFAGPPYQPFLAWALRSGRAWTSPVTLLVHDRAGLMVSYRGALALEERLDIPPPNAPPCADCAAPCRSACPVEALGPDGYDVPRCRAFLDTAAGRDCLERGCAARRACPVGADLRPEPQSAFHMAAFHGSKGR